MRRQVFLIAMLGAGLVLTACPAWAQDKDPYAELAKRDFGTHQEVLNAIEKDIQAAKPEQYGAIEAKLLAVVESSGATLAGRQFACQMLRTVGTPKCVPAMAKLLGDEKLSHMARYVLTGLADASAGEALLAGLAGAKGPQQLGIIHSLGDRGEAKAVEALAKLIGSDPALNQAALKALGKIGTAPAADAVEKAQVPDCCKVAQGEAMLACAEALAPADAARSQKLYQAVMEAAGSSPACKAAAFGALARMQKDAAVPLVLKTLQSDQPLMRRAAGSALLTITGPEAGKAFAKELAALPAEGKVTLLAVLAARGQAEGLTETVNALAGEKDASVRQAAIAALASLGDASSVKVLAGMITQGDGVGPAAVQTLTRLQGPGVNEALASCVGVGEPAVRAAVIDVVAARKQVDALEAVRKAAGDDDAKVRQSAIRALGELAGMSDLPQLIQTFLACKDNGEREALARAVTAVASRSDDREGRCKSLIDALGAADEKGKTLLLGCLGSLGGKAALTAMRASLAGEGEVKKAAVRALAEWPSPEPLADLAKIAKEDQDAPTQILALRGLVRLAGISKIDNAEKLKALGEAMTLAKRAEDKKLVLGGMGEVKDLATLKAIQPFLEDEAIKNEAFAAYFRIAESQVKRKAKQAKEAFLLVAEKAPNKGLQERARQAAEKIK